MNDPMPRRRPEACPFLPRAGLRPPRRCAAAVVAGLACLAIFGTAPARADFKVWTPDVQYGEIAIENVGDAGFDANRARSGEQSHTAEIEYGLATWWQTELEFEFARDPGPGQPTRYSQATSENLFQFTERGEYWIDAGLFFEYGQSQLPGQPSEFTLGPVLRKDFGGTSNSLNLFFERDIGSYGSSRAVFSYAFESRIDAWTWRIGRNFIEPGLQVYGTPGPVGHFGAWSLQDERAGPQLFGKIFNLGPGTLEWNGGVLFGLNASVPRTTVRWQLEYEIHY
jgi:hypothetical protein